MRKQLLIAAFLISSALLFAGSEGPSLVSAIASSDVLQQLAGLQ